MAATTWSPCSFVASEWCQDLFGTYPSTPQTNPFGPLTGTYRVIRGGNFRDSEGVVRTYARTYETPDLVSNLAVGFRIALGSPPVN